MRLKQIMEAAREKKLDSIPFSNKNLKGTLEISRGKILVNDWLFSPEAFTKMFGDKDFQVVLENDLA